MQEKPKANKIILSEKRIGTAISKLINENGIQYNKAKNVKSDIEVIPTTEGDYKILLKLLQKKHTQFHTFQLNSENPLKVVCSVDCPWKLPPKTLNRT